MKRIITGYIYDTENSDFVCRVCSNKRDKAMHIDAVLCRTRRSKKFFLAGSGGAMTAFARSNHDGTMSGADKVIVISYAIALGYAKRYADKDTLRRFFHHLDSMPAMPR